MVHTLTNAGNQQHLGEIKEMLTAFPARMRFFNALNTLITLCLDILADETMR